MKTLSGVFFRCCLLTLFLLSGMSIQAQNNFYKHFFDATGDNIYVQDHDEIGSAGRIAVGNTTKFMVNGAMQTQAQAFLHQQKIDYTEDFSKLYVETVNVQSQDLSKSISFECVEKANNGDFLIGGFRKDGGENIEGTATILRLDAAGNVLYYKEVKDFSRITDVLETTSGDLIWVGQEQGHPVVLKTTGGGVFVYSNRITLPQGTPIMGEYVQILPIGQNAYVAIGNETFLSSDPNIGESGARPFYTLIQDLGTLASFTTEEFQSPGFTTQYPNFWRVAAAVRLPSGNLVLGGTKETVVPSLKETVLWELNPFTGNVLWGKEYLMEYIMEDLAFDATNNRIAAISTQFDVVSLITVFDLNGNVLKTQELSSPGSYGLRSLDFGQVNRFIALGSYLPTLADHEIGTFEHVMASTTECGESLFSPSVEVVPITDITLGNETIDSPINSLSLTALDFPLQDAILCDGNCEDPIAENDTILLCATPNGAIGNIDVIANDTHTNLLPANISITSGPSPIGSATYSLSGTIFTVNVTPGFIGQIIFDYSFTDDCGTASAQIIVIVEQEPSANFSATATGLTVNFTDLSTGNPDTWFWYFGDGNTSTASNPTHTYAAPGTYPVCLTVDNECGSDTYCNEVVVVECGPVDPVDDELFICVPNNGLIVFTANDFISSPVFATTISGPFNGFVSIINTDWTLLYLPDPGFVGNDTIVYEICNLCGDCGSATIYITVEEAPTANFSGAATGLTVNFTDLSTGSPDNWFWDFGDGNNSAAMNPTHTYVGPGTYNVCLTVDNDCGSNTLCEEFTVNDCEPVDPVNDQFLVCSPNGGNFDILLNDFIGGSYTYTLFGGPSNGTIISDDGAGNIGYVPNPGFIGTDMFSYQLCNLCGLCGTATVTIIVEEAPTANFSGAATGLTVNFTDLSTGNIDNWFWDFGDGNNSAAMNPTHTYVGPGTYNVCLTVDNDCGSNTLCEEFTVNDCEPVDPVNDQFLVCSPNGGNFDILLNDFIGGSYTYTLFGGPSNGTIISDDGAGNIGYVPNPGFIGTDMFSYQLCNLCGLCGTATVTIIVEEAPTANFSGAATGLTVNFTDLSTGSPDNWFWDFGDGNNSAAMNPTHTYVGPGTYNVCLTVDNDCGSNTLCEEFTVNDCEPVDPVNDQFLVCSPNGGNFDILLNDFIGGSYTYTLFGGPSNGTIISDDGAGNIGYVPNPGFIGTDMFSYQLCNLCGLCGTATVTIIVEEAPTANFSGAATGLTVNFTDLSTGNIDNWFWDFGDGNNSAATNPTHTYVGPGTYNVCLTVDNDCGSNTLCEEFTVNDCEPVDPVNDQFLVCSPNGGNFDILINDFIGGSYTYTLFGGPSNGTIISDDGAGNIGYVPNPGFIGTDMFTYQLCNLCGQCGTATVTITVEEAPTANFSGAAAGLTVNFTDLSTGNIDNWFWDFGDGNNSAATNPTHTYVGPGTYNVCLTVDNDCGSNTLCEEFTVNDCEPVDPVNDQFLVCSPNGGNFDILINDFIGGSYTYTLFGGPSNGTIISDDGAGNIGYVPNPGFIGTDMFTYQLCNLCGQCGTATVTITVEEAPTANFSGAAAGLTVNFTDLSTGNIDNWFWDFGDGNNSAAMNPTHTYVGPGTYNVCLTVDNECGSNTLCEEFTVNDCEPVDPVNDQFLVCSPNGGNFDILINDFIGGSYTYTLFGGPSNGTIISDDGAGNIGYVPNPGFIGTDMFTYQLCNLCGQCGTATVTITVEEAPTANFSGAATGLTVNFTDLSTGSPDNWFWDFGDGNNSAAMNPTHTYAGPGTYNVCLTVDNDCGSNTLCEEFTVNDCEPVDPVNDQFLVCSPNGGNFDILLNDFIGGSYTYTLFGGPSNGTIISDDGAGNIGYVPNPGFIGTDMFTYQLCNLCGQCGTATVTITVEEAPTANFSGAAAGLTVNFTDLSTGNIDNWFWDFGDGNNSAAMNPTHTYVGPGTYNVCLTVDNECGSNTLCEEFTVNDCEPVDPVNDQFLVCSPNGGNFDILINDFIGGSYTYTLFGGPSNGTIISDDGAGNIGYVPNPGFIGTDMFTYQLCNLCGQCGTATVTITVEEAPTANFSGAAAGLTVNFTDLSLGNPTSWIWDFGDGNASTLTDPTHTFSSPGVYNVCLTVSNGCGNGTFCIEIQVGDCDPPIAVIDQFQYCPGGFDQFDLFLNDQFVIPNIQVNVITPPVHGNVVWINQPAGLFQYVPNTTYTNIDSFEYMVETICGIDMAWAYLSCGDTGGGVLVDPKIVLTGFFDEIGGEMRDDMNQMGLLPLTQPFDGAPWNLTDDASVSDYSAFQGSSQNVVDWILVALVDPQFPDDILTMQAGLLWQNGCITNTIGSSLAFDVEPGDYFVAVLPRNHLGLSTLNPVNLNTDQATLVDFMDPLTDTYGGTADRLPVGPFEGARSGDSNGDGAINSVDLNTAWRPQNGTSSSYSNTADFNGDGVVNSVDLNAYFRPMNGQQANFPFFWP